MSRPDSLPPDLQAVLSLLLRQRKRHAEVAAMLGIEERAVHDRAHAALALLAPRQARVLSAAEREQIGEYLLGQQAPAAESRTRAHLEESAAGRTWAQALAGELGPLTTQPLPHVPAGPPPTTPAPAATPAPQPASSRTGGAVILGGLAAVIVVAVLLIVGIGGGGGSHGAKHPSAPTTSTGGAANTSSTAATTTRTSGSHASYGKALTLTPPDPAASKAVGVAYVLTEKGQHAFYLFAKGLPPLPSGTFYAVWLEGATSAPAYPLGSLPAQNTDGLVEGGGPLPTSAGSYDRIVVTSETSHHPSHPGPAVLGGAFTLG